MVRCTTSSGTSHMPCTIASGCQSKNVTPTNKQTRHMALSKEQGVKRKRFDMEITDESIDIKHQEYQNKNTNKAEKTAQKQFTEYLTEIGCNCNEFWTYDVFDLDRHLAKFWFAARQKKVDKDTGESKKYKVQSLKSLRYALKRFLIEKGKTFDIITDGNFRKSQTAFMMLVKN